MTTPVPHWPGRMVELTSGQRVWLAETPAADRELVLLVHGMSGAATNWTDLMAELAPDFDCVAVDLPGSGFSPPPKIERRVLGQRAGGHRDPPDRGPHQ